MSTKNETSREPKIKITEKARDLVLQAQAEEFDPEGIALWIEVGDEAPGANRFNMYFKPAADAGPADSVQDHDGIVLVVPEASAAKLVGAPTVHLTSALVETGLGLDDEDENEFEPLDMAPNSPAVGIGAVPLADLSGDVAQRVIQVLDRQINPAIAMHGGRADLVAVEAGTAYLRLSGGCQGCGLAKVTLSQGIEVAIKNAAPEIDQVVDVTDHASGANPFYEPAKK